MKKPTKQEIAESTKELSLKAGVENKNLYKDLFYETKHLPFFRDFDLLIELNGKQYTCLKKARWYQLVGGILQHEIKLGGIETDTRMQVLYPLPTEAGKNALIYSIKFLICKGIKKGESVYTISEPISFSAESLVGKYIERQIVTEENGKKKKRMERIQNKGHFNNDFMELDECTKLINSNDEQTIQAREYFSKSENPIGKNEVQKRLVDDLPHEVVAYYPQNTNSFYFQPSEKIPEHIMTQGFLRRKLIPIGNIQNFLIEASDDIMSDKLKERNHSRDEIADRIIKKLEGIKANSSFNGYASKYSFTEEAKELINKYTLMILRQGKIHSEKIANFCKINKYTTQEYLVRMSCILASAYGTMQVNENHVSLAFMDLTEIMQNTYDFVFNNVKGTFDYGVTWKGAKYYDSSCLRFLYEKSAFSFDSSKISINDFLKIIQETYPNNIGTDTARKHYLNMKKNGWVDSSQDGQYDSRIWLTFNPKLHEALDEGSQGSKGYTAYKSVKEGINTIIATIEPLQPSQPSTAQKGEK